MVPMFAKTSKSVAYIYVWNNKAKTDVLIKLRGGLQHIKALKWRMRAKNAGKIIPPETEQNRQLTILLEVWAKKKKSGFGVGAI